jgi:hypothetical protein
LIARFKLVAFLCRMKPAVSSGRFL